MLGLPTGEKRQRLEEGSDSDDDHLSKQPVHHEYLSSDSDSESYGTSSVCGKEPAGERPNKRSSTSLPKIGHKKHKGKFNTI